MDKPTKRTTRCNFRLNATNLQKLNYLAEHQNATRTDICRQLLSQLVHDLQTGRELLAKYNQRTQTCCGEPTYKIDVRLPSIIIEYLRFNQLNVTYCLTSQLNKATL